jgi:hypothetical protein
LVRKHLTVVEKLSLVLGSCDLSLNSTGHLGDLVELSDVLVLLKLCNLVCYLVDSLFKLLHASRHLRKVLVLEDLEDSELLVNASVCFLRGSKELPALVEVIIVVKLIVEPIQDFIV